MTDLLVSFTVLDPANEDVRSRKDPIRRNGVRARRYHQCERGVRERRDNKHGAEQIEEQYDEPLRAEPYARNVLAVVLQSHHLATDSEHTDTQHHQVSHATFIMVYNTFIYAYIYGI